MKHAIIRQLKKTLFRLSGGSLCSLVPMLALLASVVTPAPAPVPVSARTAVVEAPRMSGDVLQIDSVLAHRAPELGLPLRRRVAEAVIEESKEAGLDPLFVLGIIELESAFDGEAVSNVGARGLMQLMPVTAEYVARLEGLNLTAEEIFRDPAIQIRLGIRYYARLSRRVGNTDHALMAYNAGPERVKQALAAGDVERFRNYVDVVKRNHARFRRGLNPIDESALARIELPAAASAIP